MAQPHNFKSGLMTIRDAEKLNELQKWIDNRRAALAIPANAFPPSYKFQAKITAYSSDDYTWVRQAFDTDGEYVDDPVPYSGGPSDMPAKERNGKIAVDFPFYAELTFRVNVQGSPYYEFDYTKVDRITIKEVDGSPSVLAKTLELPNSAMSNPSTGVARLLEASSTTGGTVTLSDQTMGDGSKTFQETVTVNNKKGSDVLQVWGTGITDPVLLTASGSVSVGGATDEADLYVSAVAIVNQQRVTPAGGFGFIGYYYGAIESTLRLFEFGGSSNGTDPFLDVACASETQSCIWHNSSSGEEIQLNLYAADGTYGWGLMLSTNGTSTAARYGIYDGAYKWGASGTLGPDATFVGGLCDYVGSGSFGTASVEDVGTSGGTVPLLNGNNTYSGSANFADAFYLSGDISPAQLTANTDNWNPTGW